MRVHRIISAVLLALAFVPQLAAASRPKQIIVLRPTADSEVRKPFIVVVSEDGTRRVYSRASAAPEALQVGETRAVDWSADLERGTYTAKRSPISSDARTAGSPRLRTTTTVGGREIVDDDGNPTYVPGTEYVGSYSVDAFVPGLNAPQNASRTIANVQWIACRDYGATEPYGRMQGFSAQCLANYFVNTGAGWSTAICSPGWNGDNDAGLFAGYVTRPGTSPSGTHEVSISVDVHSGFLYGSFSGSASTGYFAGSERTQLLSVRTINCADKMADGGGSGGGTGAGNTGNTGGTGGTPDPTCIDITDGETGEVLGTCCGNTTVEIVECAMDYASS